MTYFYNTFHNGDVHFSRTFVRDMMKKIGENQYFYLHNNGNILKDIPNLIVDKAFISFNNWQLISDYPIRFDSQIIRTDKDLFINTWVGQKGMSYLHREVDRSCSLYSHYDLYIDIYRTLGLDIEDIEYYIPEIDFNYIERENIDIFLSKNKPNFDYIILIANNDPFTVRIDLDSDIVIDKLSKENPNILFVLTNKKSKILTQENVVYVDDIVPNRPNLNEISYLSTFCKILVGFPSGPFIFCTIKDNLMDTNKTIITITSNNYDLFYFESKATLLDLKEHTINGLYEIISQKINENK